MQKFFLLNLGFLLLLNLLVKPFYIFGIDAQVQNELSDSYGNYYALINLSLIFNILLDFGVTNFNTRKISIFPHLVKKHVFEIVNLRILLFIFYTIIVFSTALLLNYSSIDYKILALLIFNQFLIGMSQYFSSNFKGLHQFKRYSIMSIMDKLLLICFCGILLWTDWLEVRMNIISFVICQTLAYIITFLMGFILTLKNGIDFNRRWNWKFNKKIIKNSLPYALLILLMSLYSRVDSVMLERMVGDIETGYYAQGYRLVDAFNMFALLFASLLLPIFSRLIKNNEKILQILITSSKILLFIGISTPIAMFNFGDVVLNTIYDQVTETSKMSFNFLIFGFFGTTLTYIFGTLLTAKGTLKKLNIIALISLIINLILNIILIPKYKSIGASIATLITQLFMGIAQLILVIYIFKFKFNKQLVKKLFIFIIIQCFIAWGLSEYNNQKWEMLFIFVFSSIIVGIIFKIIEPKSFIKMIKEKND